MSAKSIDDELLAILRCPEGGGELELHGSELWCRDSAKAYPVQNGLPVLLVEEARPLSDEELSQPAPEAN